MFLKDFIKDTGSCIIRVNAKKIPVTVLDVIKNEKAFTKGLTEVYIVYCAEGCIVLK